GARLCGCQVEAVAGGAHLSSPLWIGTVHPGVDDVDRFIEHAKVRCRQSESTVIVQSIVPDRRFDVRDCEGAVVLTSDQGSGQVTGAVSSRSIIFHLLP